MKYAVCVMRDSAANVFGVPMFMGSVGQAIRGFSDGVQRVAEDNMLNKHPEDFELYCIGTYTDEDASFEFEPRRLLVRGIDCVKR